MFPHNGRPTTAILRLPSSPYAYTNTPVLRLPNELLTEIFMIDYCACKHKPSCVHEEHGTWEYETVLTDWMRLLLVCRHWRNIACATPALWRSIPESGKLGWYELFFTRSAGMTLDVVHAWPSWSEVVLEAILAHAPRVRKLVIIIDADDASESVNLERLWRTSMPALEELTFGALSNFCDFDESVSNAILNAAAFPALRSLRLSHATFSLRLPIVSQLHTLRLAFAEPARSWTPTRVLQALKRIAENGALRHLELNCAYMSTSLLKHSPVSLRQLESLVLVAVNPVEICHLLRHLWLSPSADISLTIETYPWGEEHSLHLPALFPKEEEDAQLPILRTTSSVSVEFWDHNNLGHLIVICTSGGNHRGRLTMQLVVRSCRHRNMVWHYTLDDALGHFCNLFKVSPLTKLSLREPISDTRRASEAALVKVFRTFPKLAVVEMKYSGPNSRCDALFEALSSSSSPHSGTEQDELESPESPRVVVPRLRVLRMTQLPWRVDALPSLLTCLQHRAANGVGLGDLLVEMHGRPRGPEAEGPHDDHLRRLQSLSTRVTYLDGKASHKKTL